MPGAGLISAFHPEGIVGGVAWGPATTVLSFMSLQRLLNLQKVLNLDQSKTQPTATDLQDNAEYTLTDIYTITTVIS